MKLPIEKQAASPFNQMVELGVPVRIAKAVSQMLALPGVKTASKVEIDKSVREARSMLCADMEDMLKVANPTAQKLVTRAPAAAARMIFMSEEDEEAQEEEDGLDLALENVKVAYSVARNMGIPKERAMMMAMYAHTRLMGL